jgi:hypothetical protein
MNDKIDNHRLLKDYNSDSESLEEETSLKSSKQVRFSTLLRRWIGSLILITILSILIILLVHPISVPIPKNDEPWQSCGNTSAEARALNCQFDIMLTSWVPSACSDPELSELYLARYSYKWYTDANLTHPFPDELMRRGDHHRVFTERHSHFAHCAYMWEMQMRAFWAGKRKVLGSWETEHSKHCANILVSQDLPRNWTKLTVAFERCGYLDVGR